MGYLWCYVHTVDDTGQDFSISDANRAGRWFCYIEESLMFSTQIDHHKQRRFHPRSQNSFSDALKLNTH